MSRIKLPRFLRGSAGTPKSVEDCRRLEDRGDVAGLLLGLESGNHEVRVAAARSLCLVGDDTAVDSLLAALSDDQFMVRRWAGEALGWIGAAHAAAPLAEAGKQGHPDDQFGTMDRVVKGAVGMISARLEAADEPSRILARNWTRGSRETLLLAERLARFSVSVDKDHVTKCLDVVNRLKGIEEPAAMEGLLRACVAANHNRVRAAATDALLQRDTARISHLLLPLLDLADDNSQSSRVCNTLDALGVVGDDSATETIVSFLQRWMADRRLGGFAITDGHDLYAQTEIGKTVCRSACRALARLGGPRAAAAIEAVHQDQYWAPFFEEGELDRLAAMAHPAGH